MKILVVSDSHGNFDNVRQAIGKEAPIDMLIHAGDVEGDLVRELGSKRDYDLHVVSGNMDWGEYPEEEVIDLGKHKIYLTHGHHHGVAYNRNALVEDARENGCDIAIFGHTHVPFLDTIDGVLVLNPGSVSRPRQEGRKRTYAVMTIDGRGNVKVRHKVLSLRHRSWFS